MIARSHLVRRRRTGRPDRGIARLGDLDRAVARRAVAGCAIRRLVGRLGILAVAVALAGCGSHVSFRSGTSTGAAVAATDSNGAIRPIDATHVLAIARDGKARVTLVNVWASWCQPCRQEFPELLAATRAHRADGVRLVLISADFDEQLGDVRHFLAQNGVRDTTYLKHDDDQGFINTLDTAWSGSIPATFVYDAAGRRVAFWEGRADRARFEAAIRQALDAATAATKGSRS